MVDTIPIRVLIVDQEPHVRERLGELLRSEGCQAEAAERLGDARGLLEAEPFDVVFADLGLPDGGGLELLDHLQEQKPPPLGVVTAGQATFASALDALRARAFDFLTKPLDPDEVRQVLGRAQAVCAKRDGPSHAWSRRRSREKAYKKLIGKSAAMRTLKRLIKTVAGSSSTILIRGESGTGKELVARALHDLSPRRAAPLIPVNCGAIPEELLESELFGHVRGSFTGAITNRPGRFVLADGGTIFLDEIGDMSPKLQVKVLRVLQEQQLEPVGSAEPISVDVRVVAATNVDLEQAVEERRFREDLYYRLNVIPIEVPPLRDRLEDLPRLLEHFVEAFNGRQPRQIEGFAPEAVEVFRRFHWPGNVRELENLVERMTILSRDTLVQLEDLPEKVRNPVRRNAPTTFAPAARDAWPAPPTGQTVSPRSPEPVGAAAEPLHVPGPLEGSAGGVLASEGVTLDERLLIHGRPPDSSNGVAASSPTADEAAGLNELVNGYEATLILEALRKSDGVKSRAARMLGIKRTTLVEKMKKKAIVYEG